MTHAGSDHFLFVVWDLIESMGHNEYQNQIKKIYALMISVPQLHHQIVRQKKLRTWTIYNNNKRKIIQYQTIKQVPKLHYNRK